MNPALMRHKEFDRFRSRIVEDVNGCWRWTSTQFPNGYGAIWVTRNGKQRNMGAHRWAYLYFRAGRTHRLSGKARTIALANLERYRARRRASLEAVA